MHSCCLIRKYDALLPVCLRKYSAGILSYLQHTIAPSELPKVSGTSIQVALEEDSK